MKRLIALCLVFVILLSGCAHECKDAEYTPLATAVYPKELQYPLEQNYADYNEFSDAYSLWYDAKRQKNTLEVYDDGINDYVKNTLSVLAKDSDKNLVYSPANIYFALSMLAECTNGPTQSEILKVLGYDNVESLRKNTSNLWQKMYADNGVYASILANSIWLKDGVNYNKDTLDTLKDSYFASAYSGDFTNEGYANAVRDCMKECRSRFAENWNFQHLPISKFFYPMICRPPLPPRISRKKRDCAAETSIPQYTCSKNSA